MNKCITIHKVKLSPIATKIFLIKKNLKNFTHYFVRNVFQRKNKIELNILQGKTLLHTQYL